MSESVLTASHITLRYPGQDSPAVDDVCLGLTSGEVVALVGPSGCGKTTVLSILGGHLYPDSGKVEMMETNITRMPAHLRETATVFQGLALFPHLNVEDNIDFPLAVQGDPESERRQRREELLNAMGLEEFAKRKVDELSGGQRQRVALARAIISKPKVLLMDEPLANLDSMLKEHMIRFMLELIGKLELTVLYVTHELYEAQELADRIAIMKEGGIAQLGTLEDLQSNPATAFVAKFLGSMNVLEGNSVTASEKFVTERGTEITAPVASDIKAIGLRHEHMRIHTGGYDESATDKYFIRGRVRKVITANGTIRVSVQSSAGDWLTVAPGVDSDTASLNELRKGTEVRLEYQPDKVVLFEE